MKVIINIADKDVLCLKHDLLDIEEWVQNAVKGKISKCKKRLIKEGQSILLNDPTITIIPAIEDSLVEAIVSNSNYKNRIQREED